MRPYGKRVVKAKKIPEKAKFLACKGKIESKKQKKAKKTLEKAIIFSM